VRLLLFEENDMHDFSGSPIVHLKTNKCTPICKIINVYCKFLFSQNAFLAQDNVELNANSSFVLVKKTSRNVCNGFYRISNVTIKQAKIGETISLSTLKKFRNYTIQIYSGSHADNEIKGVSFTLKIPRSKEISRSSFFILN
jgi:hypothetical protein